ncbi:MAG: uroporphyrinogen-III synthase [Sulfitobacter sp.]
MTMPSLLITRPIANAACFVADLAKDIQQDVTIVVSPLLEIVPTGVQIDLTGFRGVIFTSSNAVELAPKGIQHPAFCVGQKTAKRAEAAGWSVIAKESTADQLVTRLAELAPTGPLLHLAGAHRRGDIAGRLSALGTPTEVIVLYKQSKLDLTTQAIELLNGEESVVAPLFSPRSAAQFIEQVPDLHNVIIIAMSEAVARYCLNRGAARVLIAATPTGQEMRLNVEKVLRDTSLA